MSDAHANQEHPYHLVEPSPWPLIGAFSGGFLATGMIVFMHTPINWMLYLGIFLVFFTMFGWWRQVVREATHEGHHTPIVQIGLRYGMLLFILSEVIFFRSEERRVGEECRSRMRNSALKKNR